MSLRTRAKAIEASGLRTMVQVMMKWKTAKMMVRVARL